MHSALDRGALGFNFILLATLKALQNELVENYYYSRPYILYI